ncbi:MAG: trypsin-like peptidase domain-containing protein [bacterium]|nr:trypsin-like peptidase domain-containing protein [bacterium]
MKKVFVILLMLCVLGLTGYAGPKDYAGKCQKVGIDVSADIGSGASTEMRGNGQPTVVWQTVIKESGATYICPHFSWCSLPDGAELVIRSRDNSRKWSYTGYGKGELGYNGEGFWGMHIHGEEAIIEIVSTAPVAENAIHIDKYARGFAKNWDNVDTGLDNGNDVEAIIGSDESGWAKCYQSSEPTIYNKSKAVMRLLINGSSACTGWLVGSEGHVMTNAHCIDSSSDAANTNFEFMAEGSCSTNCASWGACPGTIVATSSTLVKYHTNLDYALVKLPTNPTGTYGYFKLRSAGPSLNERIYIPQHPAHWGKKIAVYDNSGYCDVSSLTESACMGGSVSEVGYYADTQGGSSGSPVIAYDDHLVVALHHCAGQYSGYPNRAVPIDNIIANLGSQIPDNAVDGDNNDAPCTNCTKYSGSLTGSGDEDAQPNGNYYYSSSSGYHQGWLQGPAGADFDLKLYKWNGSGWSQVAVSETSTSNEQISYNGSAGYYYWKVYSYSGSGSYDFYLKKP